MDDRSYIYGSQTAQRELEKTKEVKMRLPVGHLIRLHSMKLLAGHNISDTVAKALTLYFEKVDADKKANRAAQSGPAPEQGVIDASF
jgi:hypothetical protein